MALISGSYTVYKALPSTHGGADAAPGTLGKILMAIAPPLVLVVLGPGLAWLSQALLTSSANQPENDRLTTLATVYDGGVRVPLAIRWPGVARPGATIDALVSLTDIAPTLLEGAGVAAVSTMTGRTLAPLLRGEPQAGRDQVFLERERHANVRRGDLSYPVRAVRTNDYLYLRNFRPDRWPAGDPELYFAVGPFGDIDGGPTKSLILNRRSDPSIAKYFELATARRPMFELYDLRRDPHQLTNIAGRPEHRAAEQRLRTALDRWMRDTADPRAATDDDRWDRFPYYGQPAK